MRKYHVVGLGLYSSGVDDGEDLASPLGLAVYAVARYAGSVLHDGSALADELIEKRAFAHIGSAYYCNYGF